MASCTRALSVCFPTSNLDTSAVRYGCRARTHQLHKQPFAQFGDELSLIDRFRMYSGPTRLASVNVGFRKRRSFKSENSRSAASLDLTFAVAGATAADGRQRESNGAPASSRSRLVTLT